MSFTSGSTPFGFFDSDAEFAIEADRFVDYTLKKLGDPVMEVHMSSSHMYASLEEACLEYSAIVNSYQAKSALATFLGGPTGSLSGSENTYPNKLLEFQKRIADSYGEEAGVNGPHPLHSGSVQLSMGQQQYDLQALMSGALSGSRMRIKEVFHFSPLSAYRFFGTTSAINYLHQQFNFESFTPETIFYLLPIWEDILRGMEFKTSNKVRRSNYSYELHDNVLTLYPTPSQNMNLYFTYTLPPDPTAPARPGDGSFAGVSNMSNVPFGNIRYSSLNSISKQWIRRFAFSLAQEIEGRIRSKMSHIPIPNGDLTLDGPTLVTDARSMQDALRLELREMLDETTYDRIAQREADMAQSLQSTLKEIPLPIWMG